MLRVAFKSNFQHFLCTIVLLKRFKVAYNKRRKFKKDKKKRLQVLPIPVTYRFS